MPEKGRPEKGRPEKRWPEKRCSERRCSERRQGMVHRLLLSFGGRRRRTIPCLLFTDFLSLCDSSYAIPFVQSLSLRRFLLCDSWTCAIPGPARSLNLRDPSCAVSEPGSKRPARGRAGKWSERVIRRGHRFLSHKGGKNSGRGGGWRGLS